ncbi:MAG: hypothetical protein GX600_09850 [Dehalococcoidia bacterium]|nr:hypothetical protein [Dehalococcoidia bacterium]
MGDSGFDRSQRRPGADGKSGIQPEDVEQLKQSAKNIVVPTVTVNQRVWAPTIAIPDVKPLSSDRRDRNAAKEFRRELAPVTQHATRAGLAIHASRAVATYVAYSIEQGQEEMMDLLYSKTRHEGMNELMASVISQCIQQMVVQMFAVSEHHFKRQMEEW